MPRFERIMADAGLDPATVELRHVDSDEVAQVTGFLGSPSVRVDGVDVEPGADERADFGMKCRLYEVDGQRPGAVSRRRRTPQQFASTDPTILAKLSGALSRARAVALAA